MSEVQLNALIRSVLRGRELHPGASPLEWLPSSTRPAARHAHRVIFAELSTMQKVASRSGVPMHILVILTYVCLANGLTVESKAQCGECWITRAEQRDRIGITALPLAAVLRLGIATERLAPELSLELAAERLSALAAPHYLPADWERALAAYCRNPEDQNLMLQAA